MTFRVKTLLPYQELLLDIEEHRKKSYADGYDLLVLRNRDGSLTVVTPEGAGQVITLGSEEELDAFIAKRRATRLVPIVKGDGEPPFGADHPVVTMADPFLAFTRAAGVFNGTSGNLSIRADADGNFLVSPSGVRKESLAPSDLVCMRNGGSGLTYFGDRVPSIDSPVQAGVYRRYPHIVAMLHVHADTVVVEDPIRTSFPYPCGTEEEVREVLTTLEEWQLMVTEGFCLEFIHHGYLIGFTLRQFLALPSRLAAFDPPTGVVAPGFSGFQRRRVVFGHGSISNVIVS